MNIIDNYNYGVVGTNPENIKNIYLITDEERKYGKIYVEYNNGNMALKELKGNVNKQFENFVNLCYSGAIQAKIAADKNIVWCIYRKTDTKALEIEEEYNKLVETNEEEKEKNNNIGPWILGSSIVLGGTGIAIAKILSKDDTASKADDKKADTVVEAPVVFENSETEIKYANTVNLDGKTWTDIEEMIKNGEINEVQGKLILNVKNWLYANNVSEDWENLTLTEAEAIEINKALKAMDKNADELIPSGEKDSEGKDIYKARWGLTSAEAFALAIRFNDYTNEELAQITGGKPLDYKEIVEDSNNAIRKLAYYNMNTTEYKTTLDGLVEFSDKEQEIDNTLRSMLRECEQLLAEKENAKAKETLKNFEAEVFDVAHSEAIRADFKQYVIDTYTLSGSLMSTANQWNKEIFAEKATDELIGDRDNSLRRSISDMACGIQQERIKQYNEFINPIINRNTGAEAAFAATAGITAEMGLDNVKTEYDELVDKTVDKDVVIGELDIQLMTDEKDDTNIEAFRLGANNKYILLNETAENSMTSGTVGQYKVVYPDGRIETTNTLPEAELVGTKKVSETEKAKKDKEVQEKAQADYQGIYDAAFGAFINGQNFTGYDANDSLAVAAVGMARSDADSYLAAKAQEGQVTGGEVTPVEIEGNGKSYPSEQAPSNGGEITVEVVNPTIEEPVVEPEPVAPVEEGTSLAEAAQEAGLTGDDIIWLFDQDIEVEGPVDVKTY